MSGSDIERVEADGLYFDGRSSRAHTVRLQLDPDTLSIRSVEPPALLARWPVAQIRHLSREAAKARPLTVTVAEDGPLPIGVLPGEADPTDQRLTINDHDAAGNAFRLALLERAGRMAERLPKSKRLLKTAVVAVVGVVAAVLLLLFVIIPGAASYIARLVPVEKEIALGESVAEAIIDSGFLGKPCSAPEGLAALEKMTARLEPVSGAYLPLTVQVLSSGEVNAFALPGGQIFLTRGLVETAGSPEEVAGVLGHEIGHVIGRDSMERVISSGATAAVLSLMFGDFTGSIIISTGVSAVLNAQFSRDVEAAADDASIEILTKAGVPARPTAAFFTKLVARYGEGGSVFDSHPLSSRRAEKFAAADDANGPPLLTKQEWAALQAICAEKGADARGPETPGDQSTL